VVGGSGGCGICSDYQTDWLVCFVSGAGLE